MTDSVAPASAPKVAADPVDITGPRPVPRAEVAAADPLDAAGPAAAVSGQGSLGRRIADAGRALPPANPARSALAGGSGPDHAAEAVLLPLQSCGHFWVG